MVRIGRRSILYEPRSFRASRTKLSFHQMVAEYPLLADSPPLIGMWLLALWGRVARAFAFSC